jgi:tRNA modification GTPase
MTFDTIAAIATPPGTGGIGVIKISGPQARRIVLDLFRHGRQHADGRGRLPNGAGFQSHRLYHGFITEPPDGGVVDEVLLTVMDGPRSYTGEDVAEIQAHAGSALLEKILCLVLAQGARLAEPGEFTRRAFVNGRIDLTQAEAVMDAIHAENEIALGSAARQLNGELRSSVAEIRSILADLGAEFEAAIDFPEAVENPTDTDRILAALQQQVAAPLQNLVQRHQNLNTYRDGLRLVIVGRPNVGKSSLMNRLLNQSRAIVTPYPGTTRDFVQENMVLEGVPVQLTDTAGMHATDNPVERMGIEKSRQCLDMADLLLLVVDASQPLTCEDERIYEACRGKPAILVCNKTDRTADAATESGNGWGLPAVPISALLGEGIEALKSEVLKIALGGARPPEHPAVIPNLRHRKALESVLSSVDRIREGLCGAAPVDLLSLDLRDALDGLDTILGDKIEVDVLDRIFARFCIGK